MTLRTASCHCGQIELACEGAPRKISMCHCLECQRRTGSAFSIAVFYAREMVRVERGDPASFKRPSASGKPVTFHFCRRCGSNLYWEPERLPGLIGVAVGAFADPGFPAPEQSVWTQDKHLWLNLPDSLAQHEMNPPPRKPGD